MRRRICAVTTTRADYGLLRLILRRILEDRRLELSLVVSGAHLSSRFGSTVREIEADGLPIAARVPMLAADDRPVSAARAAGAGLGAFGGVLHRLRPDWLLLLGDRYELLAPASAAVALGLPIAHLHGGESTEGVIDEQVRHALTKLANLHLVAAEPYRRRVIQMGEDPSRVITVGAPGLEAAALLEPTPVAELEARLGMPLDGRTALVTFHPERAEAAASEARRVLAAASRARLRVAATFAGADAGGRAVNAALRAAARPGRVAVVPSLGQRGYLSLMARCAVVLGNSSSGILEAPVMRVPTVNVGERQRGRLRAASVIDADCSPRALDAALRRALSPAFRRACRGATPYRGGSVSRRVVDALAGTPLGALKSFHDRPESK